MSFCEKKYRLRFHDSFRIFLVLSSTSYTIGLLLVVHASILLAIPQANTVIDSPKQVAAVADTINDSIMPSLSLSNARQLVYVNDVNPLITQYTKTKQNINNPLTAGKPSGVVPASNLENRSVLGNSKKNVNEKNQQSLKGNTDSVIFPTPPKRVDPRNTFQNTEIVKSLIPNEQDIAKCKDAGVSGLLCAGLNNYPTDAVRNILNSYSIAVDLLANDSRPEDMLETKFHDDGDYKPICQATEQFYEPEIGKTVSGQWKFIFQLPQVDKRYIQRIRVEHCKNELGPCDLYTYAPGGSGGYSLRCMQKFVHRRLIAVSPDAQPVPDYFLLPSCCVCMYKDDVQLRTSFRSPQKPGSKPAPAPSKQPSAPVPPTKDGIRNAH